MSKIFAVDPGTLKLGWSVLHKGKLLDSGAIELNPKLDVNTRVSMMAQEISKLFAKHEPHHLAVEEAFYAKNVQSYGKLMMARGAIIAIAIARGMTVHEYAAKKVKESFAGTSTANKDDMVRMACLQFGLKAGDITEDQADAIAIAVTHHTHSNVIQNSGSKLDVTMNSQYRSGTARGKSSRSKGRQQWSEHLAQRA